MNPVLQQAHRPAIDDARPAALKPISALDPETVREALDTKVLPADAGMPRPCTTHK